MTRKIQALEIERKRILGSGNGKCKGPETEANLQSQGGWNMEYMKCVV